VRPLSFISEIVATAILSTGSEVIIWVGIFSQPTARHVVMIMAISTMYVWYLIFIDV